MCLPRLYRKNKKTKKKKTRNGSCAKQMLEIRKTANMHDTHNTWAKHSERRWGFSHACGTRRDEKGLFLPGCCMYIHTYCMYSKPIGGEEDDS